MKKYRCLLLNNKFEKGGSHEASFIILIFNIEREKMKKLNITDEVLIDYVDGELSPNLIPLVEEMIKLNPKIKDRVEMFETVNRVLEWYFTEELVQ